VSRQGGIRDGKRGMCAPFDGDGCCGLCGLRTIVFCREQRFCICCEQRFSVHCGIGCEPVIFCGLLACCEQGTECSGL
jgi:hypothetical protein